MRRSTLFLSLAVLLAGSLAMAQPGYAQTGERCFAETGFCISGAIRTYWERNGGLARFGFPISAVVDDTAYHNGSAAWGGQVQWFERARLEIHPELGGRILPGRIGAELHFRLTQSLVIAKPATQAPQPGCRFFPATGQNLCEPYLNFWERNGGVAQLGYPVGAPAVFTSGAWSGEVQWFERVRIERHRTPAGETLMLGRLGNEYRNNEPSAGCTGAVFEPLQRSYESTAFRVSMGCPLIPVRNVRAAEQYFERGVMIWIELTTPSGALDRRIFVIRGTPLPLAYSVFYDGWQEGDPANAGLAPPPGRYEPQRGFGKVWRDFPEVRAALGWATLPEAAHNATVQPFYSAVDAHTGLVWFEDTEFFFAFGPGTQVTAFHRHGAPFP
jgi:hypothetical protein